MEKKTVKLPKIQGSFAAESTLELRLGLVGSESEYFYDAAGYPAKDILIQNIQGAEEISGQCDNGGACKIRIENPNRGQVRFTYKLRSDKYVSDDESALLDLSFPVEALPKQMILQQGVDAEFVIAPDQDYKSLGVASRIGMSIVAILRFSNFNAIKMEFVNPPSKHSIPKLK